MQCRFKKDVHLFTLLKLITYTLIQFLPFTEQLGRFKCVNQDESDFFTRLEVLCFKMFPPFLLYNVNGFLFCLSAFWLTSHFCFSENLLQTPVNVKKVEIFKLNTFAFALVVLNHTNVATRLLYLLDSFTC